MPVLRRDLVIPKGTVFESIDCVTRKYVSGNCEALVSLTPDLTASIVLPIEAFGLRRTEADVDTLIDMIRRS